jgi:hypothetical protein
MFQIRFLLAGTMQMCICVLIAALPWCVHLVSAQPPNPVPLPRTTFTAVASSEESPARSASKVLDGSRETFWHSKYSSGLAKLPHQITINFGGIRNIAGLVIWSRNDAVNNGLIGQYTISISAGGKFAPVARGAFANAKGPKRVTFKASAATAVQIAALTEAGGRGEFTSISEVDVLGYAGPIPAEEPAVYGRWGPQINMPHVPVAAALTPSGSVRVPSFSFLVMLGPNGMMRFNTGITCGRWTPLQLSAFRCSTKSWGV